MPEIKHDGYWEIAIVGAVFTDGATVPPWFQAKSQH
jgi:hypothetical protein